MGPHAIWTGPALTIVGDLAAVLLLTGYVHLLWRRSTSPLTPEAAQQAFRREHPLTDVRGLLVLADGRTALVRTTEGELGVVTAQARGFTSRLIRSSDVQRISRRPDGSVRLGLRDYAHPHLVLRFAPEHPSVEWLAPLESKS